MKQKTRIGNRLEMRRKEGNNTMGGKKSRRDVGQDYGHGLFDLALHEGQMLQSCWET